MLTIKLPYTVDLKYVEVINLYIKQYNNCLHVMYNRTCENIKEKELTYISKSLNNIELLDSWFVRSSIDESNRLYNNLGTGLIFGGKKLFKLRNQNKITKEKFKEQRLSPLYSVGEANTKGNRKFKLTNNVNELIFQPNKETKIILGLPKMNKARKQVIQQLFELQEKKLIPITYQLSKNFIYIIYDERKLSTPIKTKPDRILSLDLNPNYLGISIVDWKNNVSSDNENFKIVASKVYNIKQINNIEQSFKNKKLSYTSKERISLNNKRTFETYQISKSIMKLVKYYQVDMIAIENLEIKNKDNKLGKTYNKLVNNNWLRNKFVSNLTKRANLNQVKVQMILPQYSSIIGNTMFRETGLPDMVLASLEISRRVNLFNHIYLKKDIEKQDIIFPSVRKFEKTINYLKSLEEFKVNYSQITNWKTLGFELKNSKVKYRVPLSVNDEVFKLNSFKSKVEIHNQLINK